jgi:CheY-like chemotaxis protein
MPKLILLDLYLPERNDGWQVLSEIRALTAPCNQVPVVMLSSSNVQADITEAYRRGSSSYLVKPTAYSEWLDYFKQLRTYWWETVTLPPMRLAF